MNSQNQSLKNTFIQEQENKTDVVMEEAQRFVNLFRHSDAFGEEFMTTLDKELLAISPEVEVALSHIQGGEVVRKYCAFLKDKNKIQTETTDSENTNDNPLISEGYLPSPEYDKKVETVNTPSMPERENADALENLFKTFLQAHKTELEQLLKTQSDTLTTLLQRMDQNTLNVATHQTDRLINAIQNEGNQPKYSDIIETTNQTPVLVPDEMEGF